MMDPERVLVIGHGFSGKRFTKVIRYIEKMRPELARLVGICDNNAARLTDDCGAARYDSLQKALFEAQPSVAIVAVNESAHFDVLRHLGDHPPGRRLIIAEKPLTETLDQAMTLRRLLADTALAINFIERYSPIIDTFFAWRAANPAFRPSRVEFFWGKDRIRDPRPTIGVLSEITHPLDLVGYLFGMHEPRVTAVHATESDFAERETSCLDTVDVWMDTADYRMIGHASFCWSQRLRRVAAIMREPGGTGVVVNFDFDMPRWDCDRLTIRRCGEKETIFDYAVDHQFFPRSLEQIGKVNVFTARSIESFRNGQVHSQQVGFEGAVANQRLTAMIADAVAAGGGAQRTPLFR